MELLATIFLNIHPHQLPRLSLLSHDLKTTIQSLTANMTFAHSHLALHSTTTPSFPWNFEKLGWTYVASFWKIRGRIDEEGMQVMVPGFKSLGEPPVSPSPSTASSWSSIGDQDQDHECSTPPDDSPLDSRWVEENGWESSPSPSPIVMPAVSLGGIMTPFPSPPYNPATDADMMEMDMEMIDGEDPFIEASLLDDGVAVGGATSTPLFASPTSTTWSCCASSESSSRASISVATATMTARPVHISEQVLKGTLAFYNSQKRGLSSVAVDNDTFLPRLLTALDSSEGLASLYSSSSSLCFSTTSNLSSATNSLSTTATTTPIQKATTIPSSLWRELILLSSAWGSLSTYRHLTTQLHPSTHPSTASSTTIAQTAALLALLPAVSYNRESIVKEIIGDLVGLGGEDVRRMVGVAMGMALDGSGRGEVGVVLRAGVKGL
ncbi:hypothetical protein HDU97_004447 [Phlyctochytrium planicorne]|nr:hypothetical protein HDU97_004447 [Phlyctochytrium planicorne]